MNRFTVVGLLVLSACASLQSSAQTEPAYPRQKAGLWEFKQIKQITDGKDISAQMAAAQEKMQQALAGMNPEQRAQMKSMMGGMLSGPTGTMKICVSAAMAAKNQPVVDKNGQCLPAKISHSGNQTTFEFNCARDGHTTVGTGTSTLAGDVVSTNMNMTMTDATGQHTLQSDSQMTYLGADCRGVTPIDQLVQNAKLVPH